MYSSPFVYEPDAPVTQKTNSQECHLGPLGTLHVGASSMQGWKPYMTNEVLCMDVPSAPDHVVLAIFDGHGGMHTAAYAKQNLMSILEANVGWKSYIASTASDGYTDGDSAKTKIDSTNSVHIFTKVLEQVFAQIDENMFKQQQQQEQSPTGRAANASSIGSDGTDGRSNVGNVGSSSSGSSTIESTLSFKGEGSTALVCIVTPTHIVCANAGDSRAVLGTVKSYSSSVEAKAGTETENQTQTERMDRGSAILLTGGNTIGAPNAQNSATIDATAFISTAATPPPPPPPPAVSYKNLSRDHRPDLPDERSRIEAAGGVVSFGLLAGDLSISRGLGHFRYKKQQCLMEENSKKKKIESETEAEVETALQNSSNSNNNSGGSLIYSSSSSSSTVIKSNRDSAHIVTCVPEVRVHRRNDNEDFVLLLGSAGLFNVISSEDSVYRLQEIFDLGEKSPMLIAEELIDGGLYEGKSRENMSAIVCLFNKAKEMIRGVGNTNSKELSGIVQGDSDENLVDQLSGGHSMMIGSSGGKRGEGGGGGGSEGSSAGYWGFAPLIMTSRVRGVHGIRMERRMSSRPEWEYDMYDNIPFMPKAAKPAPGSMFFNANGDY